MKGELLITGAHGTLGKAIRTNQRASDFEIHTPTRQELDITNYDSVQAYAGDNTMDVVLHMAAGTNWEQLHADPVQAMNVNAIGTLNMARLAKERNARLIVISTDAVFPGTMRKSPYTERSKTGNPVSVYGVSKLAGEYLARQVHPDVLIARLGWLFGPTPQTDVKFVGAVLRRIAQGNTQIKAVVDKFGSPTYAVHAAEKIFHYIDSGTTGTRHVVNQGSASRFDVAEQIIAQWQAPVTLEGVPDSAFPSPVTRPDYSVMTTLYPDALLPDWREALREYYEQYPDITHFHPQSQQ